MEWRDVLLTNAGSFSLLKILPLRLFFLLDNIDPDDEDAANFFEYLSWERRISMFFKVLF